MNRTLFQQLFKSTPLCPPTCECVCGLYRIRCVSNSVSMMSAFYKTFYTCCLSHAYSPPLSPPPFFALMCMLGISLLWLVRACTIKVQYLKHSVFKLHLHLNHVTLTVQEVCTDLQEMDKGKDSSEENPQWHTHTHTHDCTYLRRECACLKARAAIRYTRTPTDINKNRHSI